MWFTIELFSANSFLEKDIVVLGQVFSLLEVYGKILLYRDSKQSIVKSRTVIILKMMFLIQIRYIQYCDQLYLYRPTQGNPGNFCL